MWRNCSRHERPLRVVIEVGTHSAWVREVVVSCGHEVLVANPRRMDGTKRRKRKNDRVDANQLARVGRMDPQSLFPSSTGVRKCGKTWWCYGRGMHGWRRGRNGS